MGGIWQALQRYFPKLDNMALTYFLLQQIRMAPASLYPNEPYRDYSIPLAVVRTLPTSFSRTQPQTPPPPSSRSSRSPMPFQGPLW